MIGAVLRRRGIVHPNRADTDVAGVVAAGTVPIIRDADAFVGRAKIRLELNVMRLVGG